MASRLPKLPTRARNCAAKPADARREKSGGPACGTVIERHTSEPEQVKTGRLRLMAVV
jgi:hypothetical protein